MAIGFPRAMPAVGIISSPLRLERVDFLSPEQGGRLGAVTAGFPLWRLGVNLTNMSRAHGDIWEAWLLSLRGSQRQFLGYDPTRALPAAYAAGGAYTDAASDWEQTIDGDDNAALELTGLSSAQILSVGDYIGFRWESGAKRAMVRVVEGATASAGVATVLVEPPVPTLVPADAVAHTANAMCLMRLVTEETALGEPALGNYVMAGGRVTGIQDLRA